MTDQRSASTPDLKVTGVPVTPGRPVAASDHHAAPTQLSDLQIGRAVA